jgi:hypothetical protein
MLLASRGTAVIARLVVILFDGSVLGLLRLFR